MKGITLKDRESLHTAIFNCTLCKDHGYFVKRVQPPWDPRKTKSSTEKWGIIVGQSPGYTELERARESEKHKTSEKSKHVSDRFPIAFTGDAGRRLLKWLEEAGFTRHQLFNCFVKTAVTLCYPGRTNYSDRKPTKQEIQLCRPFLEQRINLVNPSTIIPMGKVAINWFVPEVKKLEEVVGKRRQWTENEKAYDVVCLPHSSNVSAWWKLKKNQQKLQDAKLELSKLREQSCPT
jgi:uracil-DNA glycosylase family 4